MYSLSGPGLPVARAGPGLEFGGVRKLAFLSREAMAVGVILCLTAEDLLLLP